MKNLAIFVTIALLVGCAMYGGPGVTGAFPGTVITNATYPGTAHWSQVNYNVKDYEVIGEVNATAESKSILGVVANGDSGYIKLYKEAIANGADDVINVKIDTHYYNVLGVFSKVTTKLYGIAIKWKK